jgi:bacillithiol biosynthesis cysteine-adding enzyme BshC
MDDAVGRASRREMPRAELAAAIVARLEQLGAPPESVAAAKKIAQPKSVVVVAGQQPVLFGGPGLVWAKACDAIALARAIEEQHGVPAVAVFWNASEDHDHAECDHVRMELGTEVEQLRVPLPGDRRMLSRVPVPAEARALLETLRAKFPQGPSRDEILAALEPAAGDTMGSWFSRILLRLLGRHGLVVVEPETLRPFAKSVVAFELSHPGELAASIRRAEAAAVEKGEPVSLDLQRDELFFVVDESGRRLRVARDGEAWRVEDGRSLSTAEMRALPASAFSWNVATRVLAQDIALPVAAQVCGPSEIVYCARVAAAHAALGVPAPTLYPRADWRVLTFRIERLCRELGVQPAVVAWKGADAFSSESASEPGELQAIRDLLAKLPSAGSAAVQRRHAGLVHGVAAYGEALARDSKERDSVRAERIRRLIAVLRPDGEQQDRKISPLPWVALHGVDLVLPHVETSANTMLDRPTRPTTNRTVYALGETRLPEESA